MGVVVEVREAGRFSPEKLAGANINPITRLATDYLNHFNNVVMLLELVPDMPDFAEEVRAWAPVSYVDYFTHSHFRERELAIDAYGASDRQVRLAFESIVAELDATIGEAQSMLDGSDPSEPERAHQIRSIVCDRLKPLIAEASSIINGQAVTPAAAIELAGVDAQEKIDELFP